MTREEEYALIERVLDGDQGAFEPLVVEHQDWVFRLALYRLDNESDAEDAAQEAFLKAYTALKTFRKESRFKTWLYRLVCNVCTDFARRRARQDAQSLHTENEDGEETEADIRDERYTPEKLTIKAEDVRMVREAMDALPADCREILVLREIGGLSYDELSRALGLEPGTVKSRLNRARKKLYALLIRSGNISDDLASETTKGGAEK